MVVLESVNLIFLGNQVVELENRVNRCFHRLRLQGTFGVLLDAPFVVVGVAGEDLIQQVGCRIRRKKIQCKTVYYYQKGKKKNRVGQIFFFLPSWFWFSDKEPVVDIA